MSSAYADRFREAEARTRAWHEVRLGLAFDVLRSRAGGLALATLPDIGRILDSPALEHFGMEDIRVRCAEIHRSVFANQHYLRYPCVLTVGDVHVDGVPHYGTTYAQLDEEMRGLHRDSDRPYPCHVWLTFPDMHIVDVTFLIYYFPAQIPRRFRWSDYITCSDPHHRSAMPVSLRYMPMLVGEPCVTALVDTQLRSPFY